MQDHCDHDRQRHPATPRSAACSGTTGMDGLGWGPQFPLARARTGRRGFRFRPQSFGYAALHGGLERGADAVVLAPLNDGPRSCQTIPVTAPRMTTTPMAIR